jgi:hypothetical protein
MKLFRQSFGTVEGQIGLLEQHPRLQAPYNYAFVWMIPACTALQEAVEG